MVFRSKKRNGGFKKRDRSRPLVKLIVFMGGYRNRNGIPRKQRAINFGFNTRRPVWLNVNRNIEGFDFIFNTTKKKEKQKTAP